MSDKTYRVRQGGLMRCCLQTLDSHVHKNGPGEDGDRVACEYCTDSWMIREDDVWRRHHE